MDFNTIERITNLSVPIITKEYEDIPAMLGSIKDLQSCDKFEQRLTLCLLSVVVDRVDEELFNENVYTWMRNVMHVMNTIPVDHVLIMCHQILSSIVKRSILNDRVSREISLKAIEPLLSILTGSCNSPLKSTFKLLVTIIKCYPSPCWKHHKQMEKLILKSMSSSIDIPIQRAACYCLPFISYIGTGGEKRMKHSTAWLLLFNRCIKTTKHLKVELENCLVNKDSSTESKENDEIKLIDFGNTSNDEDKYSIEHVSKLSSHIQSLLYTIQSFLSESTPFQVEIPLSHLVYLFQHISNLASQEVKSYHINKKDVDFLTCDMLNVLLETLMVFISQFDTLLLPYYDVIADILLSTLTSDSKKNKKNSYKCINQFLKSSKVIPKDQHFIERVIEIICTDVASKINQVFSSTVANSEDKLPFKNTSKKNKKKNNAAIALEKEIVAAASNRKNSFIDNSDDKEALETLKAIIIICGPSLKPFILKGIVSSLVESLVKIYNKNNSIKVSKTFLLNLFKIVNELINLYHHEGEIPLSIFINFIQMGSCDEHSTISEYCSNCLMHVDRWIHPSNPVFREESNTISSTDLVNGQNNKYDDDKMEENDLNQKLPTEVAEQQPISETVLPIEVPIKNISANLGGLATKTKQTTAQAPDAPKTSPTKNSRKRSVEKQTQEGDMPELKRTCHSVDDLKRADNVTHDRPIRPQSEPVQVLHTNNPSSNDVISSCNGNEVVVVDSSGEEEDEAEKVEMKTSDNNNKQLQNNDSIETSELDKSNSQISKSSSKSINIDDDDVEAILETFCEIAADA